MESNLGANIKNFRKSKGYTQEELAGMLGVTPQAVSRWESESGRKYCKTCLRKDQRDGGRFGAGNERTESL